MLCPNHKVSKFTTSHNSNLSHDWNNIQVIIDRRPLRDFVARAPTSRSACGGALNDEISHAERAFSLLLAGGALARAMKLTAGGRGPFSFEGLYRSEHLLHDKVNANVALVESEKTAVICSLLLPEYIWLATGGKSQFNDRLMVLKGRKVTAFPDIDVYEEWRKKTKNYPMLDITISDILERNATPEQRERQVDIADLLLEEMLKET